jgi:universal stress protein A
MLPIHTILHPTDFSPQSANAFHLACALARDHGARLLLVHVFQPPPVTAFGEFGVVPTDIGEDRDQAQASLEAMVPEGARLDVERHLVDGEPAHAIVDFARAHKCSLIVMGTHGRTGFERLLMGSAAEHVVRTAPCPVLTVKTPLPELAEVTAESAYA